MRQVGIIKHLRRNFVKRKFLTKEIFLKKQFDLSEVHAGNPNKLRVQEEYLMYTIKLEDPLLVMFSSEFCNASKFYATEIRTTQTLYPNVRIINIDVEEHPWVVDDFQLQSGLGYPQNV